MGGDYSSLYQYQDTPINAVYSDRDGGHRHIHRLLHKVGRRNDARRSDLSVDEFVVCSAI